jgi:hypothetical protein
MPRFVIQQHDATDPVAERPESVVSGRTIAELGE